MKKVISKISIITFIFSLFFLGINFVLAQTLTSVEDPSNCSSVINYSALGYSTNSNGGTTYTTSQSSVLQWYINKPNAINLAASGNSQDNGVCNGTRTINDVTPTQWKKDLCISNINSLINHQKELFNYFKSQKSISTGFGFDSHTGVWGLQYLMGKASCTTSKDCKLGVNTISNFLFCNVCKAINSGWIELSSFNPNKCDEGYKLTDDDLCCEPLECKAPSITIDGQTNKTGYSGNNDLAVKIDYSENNDGAIAFNTGKITITGGSGKDFQTNDKVIKFTLTPDSNSNKIEIDVENGCATLETQQCSGAKITLNRDIPCQDKKKWAQCTNSGDFLLSGDATDLSALNGQKCKLEGYDNSGLDFCPGCDFIKKSEKSCEESHGSGRYEDTNGCCVNCGSDKKWDKDNCVCIKTNADCESKGERLNEKTCKCECDPTKKCCGILLNTVVPFIGDCIEMTTQNDVSSSNDSNTSTVNQLNAFPFLMMGLSKIVVTVILIFSFLIIIAAGLMMTTGVYSEQNYKKGMERVQKVVVGLILLGASGLILKLINPSFFGG
ncbi:MAG TPA: hypothetical protein PLP73_03330 [Candidatus Absconditabacterales bacterium]|nr:hypothetical protein [Candidatus Absconditabacterales bacterium]HRU50355.1 hypothetical protein [Candidatus Absconditabacterales bacterium]